jgi:hypothetical protein
MTVSRKRVLAALVPSARVAAVLVQSEHIVQEMTGNAYFPKPNPSLATIAKLIDALRAAESLAQTRARGTAQARNAALSDLLTALHALKAYVQQVADADHEHAVAIIESSGFAVKKPTTRSKSVFEVRQGHKSGLVRIMVRSVGKRVAYRWQYSEDGAHWIDLEPTLSAQTTLDSLTPGKTYYFRFAVVTKNGRSDWSEPYSFMVK